MGLLDDAIREHLELKRRRGDDPTEIERLEREALGPVRRGPQQTANGTLDYEPTAGVVYTEDEVGEDWAERLEVDPPQFEQALESETPRHHEIAEEWDAHGPHPVHELADEEPFAEQQLADDHGAGPDHGAGARETPPPAAAPHVPDAPPQAPFGVDEPGQLSEETAEYDVEAEHAHRGEGEDVLEETPEFLQDTPDHDRLWFEQRPPKDFDFDG